MTTVLYVLGLGLAAMAAVVAHRASQHGWDPIELAIAAGFLAGSVALLRKAGGLLDSTKPPARKPGAGA